MYTVIIMESKKTEREYGFGSSHSEKWQEPKEIYRQTVAELSVKDVVALVNRIEQVKDEPSNE